MATGDYVEISSSHHSPFALDSKSINKRLMKFGVTVLLSGFLALASVYYIIQISDQSPQSLMTLASLHYRDTSVKNIHPPDNLISSPGWSYGDRVEILNQKSIENRNYANQSWNYFQRDKLNLIELNEDRDNNFESNENNEFDLSDFDEDAEYHHSDPTVDRFPVYFSKNTLRNKAGEYRKNHDDRICSEAGKHRDFNPKRCLGAPYLYVTYHGGSSRKRIKNICKYTRDGCSLGSVLMPSSNYHPHSLRGMLHHQNFLFVAEAWRKVSLTLFSLYIFYLTQFLVCRRVSWSVLVVVIQRWVTEENCYKYWSIQMIQWMRE